MIEFQNVCFEYGKTETLHDVSFHIKKGDFVAILGANGAGKTTISKLMNGILKPSRGDVLVFGENTKKCRSSKLAKRIGFLFQNPDRQICKNTVRDEIMFSLMCVNSNIEYCQKQCNHIMEEFHLPSDKNPFRLSRGERQRLALASAIANEPDILVLDEPTTGLDYLECMHIMNYIKEQNNKGVTVVMVTHDMELTLDFAKQVLVMNHGTLLQFSPMRNVMKNEPLLAEAKLMPPQIAALAMRFPEFEEVYTNEEMLRHIAIILQKNGNSEVQYERIS